MPSCSSLVFRQARLPVQLSIESGSLLSHNHKYYTTIHRIRQEGVQPS